MLIRNCRRPTQCAATAFNDLTKGVDFLSGGRRGHRRLLVEGAEGTRRAPGEWDYGAAPA